MVEIVSIFVTTIINNSLLISFLMDQKILQLRLGIIGLVIYKMIWEIKISHLSTKLFLGQITWPNQ